VGAAGFEPATSREVARSPAADLGDQNGPRWAGIIDFLTLYPDARRRVVRLLGKIRAAEEP
jgi:hypothetical protein